MRLSIIFTAASLGLAPLAGAAEDRPQPENTTAIGQKSLVRASDYMVVSAHPLASEAGREILARGGSAADAAVAVQMVLNLVEPQSSGIGGGAFLLYWSAASGSLASYDGRETAPMAAGPDYWLGPDGAPMDFFDAIPGGRSVGVPGTVKLMEEIHARHGRLPWADLFEPAIRLAEDGFEVSQRLSASIAETEGLDEFPVRGTISSMKAARLLPKDISCATRASPGPCASSPPKAASLSIPVRSRATLSPRPSPPGATPAC